MGCCSHCQDTSTFFGESTAEKELRQYRESGLPNETTRQLVDALKDVGLRDRTLLDVGGGVGVIPHELLEEGLSEATLVEASHPYLEVAKNEAQRRGDAERTAFRYGDFVELAPDLDAADIVTLDRVICCYPHMERLVEASTGKAKRWYGVVYPKDRWFIGAGFSVVNLYCRLRGIDFQVYRHSRIDETIRGHGFEPSYQSETILWKVALYERTNGAV